ncbi:MAG: TolC family protein [Deltaproteobacteria bacterium]|nr:TolC family protein [Deltaproteobacteria bacterium]
MKRIFIAYAIFTRTNPHCHRDEGSAFRNANVGRGFMPRRRKRHLLNLAAGKLPPYILLCLLSIAVPVYAKDTDTDTGTDTVTDTASEQDTQSPLEAAGLSSAVTIVTQDLTPPELTPGPQITLNQALQKAAGRNLDLQSARMEIEKAKAGLSKTWGLVLPILQGKFEYTHMDHEDTLDLAESMGPLSNILGPLVADNLNLFTPQQLSDLAGMNNSDPLLINPQDKIVGSIDLMVPLVKPEAWLQIKTARQGVHVAELSIQDAERKLLLGVSQAYFMVLTTQNLIDFHFSQMKTAKEQLRIANARFNAGRAMRIDVIRAETDFEQASSALQSSLLTFDNARDTLGQLLGMDDLPLPADSPTLEVPKGDVNALEKQATDSRMEIKIIGAKQTLLERQKKTVQMKFLPTLDMVWHGSYQFTDMPDMGSDDKSRWALMFSLTIPLYDHFRYADLDMKRAEIRQEQINLENAKQKASLAVRKARRDYANALVSVTTAEKQIALAMEGLQLTEAAYRGGRGTSLDVTMARQAHTSAGLNLATARLKSQLALLSYLDAVGEELASHVKQ